MGKRQINLLLKRFQSSLQPNYVPRHFPASEKDITTLGNFIKSSNKILILTGAGISTESGIPDYRSEGVGLYARTNHKPIQHMEFLQHVEIRKRYWARNFIGFKRFANIQPNNTHKNIKNLEEDNKVSCIVTQNVDNLHNKAGSENVIELHGTGFRVICLTCKKNYKRTDIQNDLIRINPGIDENAISNMIRPDGDVEISQELIEKFKPPFCSSCGGILKPDIVFFGDNVPKPRVEEVNKNLKKSNSVLVLGSSLTVFSSYRIILQALEWNKNICIVNIGSTRADSLVPLKIEAKCGDILPKLLY